MKTYLTKQGLLVVRDDASFFTSNSGEFRRIATADEVEYLTDFLQEISIHSGPIMRETGRKQFHTKLERMEIPLWYYLWSVSNDDYSAYKRRTCNNGGDYSFQEHIHFFTRCINGEWEIRTLTTYSTSAEFSYDEINGSFQNDLRILTVVGLKNEWHFLTRTSSGEDEEIAIDQLLDEGSWDMDAALQAAGHYTPERDSDEEEHDYEIDKAESDRRCLILNAIGFEEPTLRRSGRNQRR